MKRKDLIILIVGAAALYLWYRSRQGAGAVTSGQGTGNPAQPNTNLIGNSGGLQGSGSTDTRTPEQIRLAARDAYTGPGSRGTCLYPNGRWIDTVDGPAYGYCVDQAAFNLWTSKPRGDIITNSIAQTFFRANGLRADGSRP